MPVPEEVHLDPAILVGVDLFTCGAGNDCGLRAGGVGSGGDALTAPGYGAGHGVDLQPVGGGAVAAAAIAAAHVLGEAVGGPDDEVALVLVGARVFAQVEQVAGRQVAGVAGAVNGFALGLLLFDAHTRILLAIAHLGIAAGPVEDFPRVLAVACGLRLVGVQQGAGFFEVVVVGGKFAAGYVLSGVPTVDEVFVMDVGGPVAGVVGDGAGAGGQ